MLSRQLARIRVVSVLFARTWCKFTYQQAYLDAIANLNERALTLAAIDLASAAGAPHIGATVERARCLWVDSFPGLSVVHLGRYEQIEPVLEP